jgi:nicotinate-nucleotide adenylyltransferase
MKIGLFFGSFNPIHIGHLAIANYMLEFTELEKIWFVVTPHNPLKKKETLLPDIQRLRMVREAIGDFSKFRASDIEFKLPQPSYTINTLAYLEEKFPEDEFALIMGTDNLGTLDKWKNYEQILDHYKIYTYPRPGSDGGKFADHKNVTITKAPMMDISSTMIREAIKNKKDIRFLLPEAVWNYISEMHFYEK